MGLFSDTVMADYARRVIALKGQQDRMFKLALDTKVIKELIIDLNTEKQLKQGKDSLGQDLFNKITQRSVYAQSDPLGRGGQPYEVFQTGKYWFSFKVDVGNGVITINSDPQKETGNLFDIYTPKIVGLTDENLQILIDEALKHFIRWYEDNILPR